MNNAEVIRYANEVVRPLSEELRALQHRLADALTTWHGGIGAQVTGAQASEPIEDGRENEGVSRLTANDLILSVSQFTTLNNDLTASGVPAVISKPCVRPLEVH